jgi:predicted ATP-grasp superfamily ATP-dependent carboligase
MGEPILILGASGRAAAFSALRAGLTPVVIDLFADEDLRAVADVRPIAAREYPRGLVERAGEVLPMPWIYTGGIENHPDIVAQIAAERPLLGNGPEVLAKVRDPFALAAALDEAGLPHPHVRRYDDPPAEGPWLEKPLRGSGGAGIRPAKKKCTGAHRYFQEFMEGEGRAAIFRDGELLGVTRQLVGKDWLHAPRFGYCGSVGPVEGEAAEWKKLGEVLVQWSGIRGVFGIDAIVRDGVPWLIEVNPRYTASVEILELAVGTCALRPSPPSPLPQSRERGARSSPLSRLCGRGDGGEGSYPLCGKGDGREGVCVAKAVYYAPRTVTIPQNGPWQAAASFQQVPEFADIPRAGSTVRRGRPVITMFGQDENDLREKARLLDSLFGMKERP